VIPAKQGWKPLVVLAVCASVVGCSDAKPGPPTASEKSSVRTDVTPASSVTYNMDDVAADFPNGTYAIDSDSAIDSRGTPLPSPDLLPGSEDFCRDAFKPVYLYWNGPNGIVGFLLPPPQLFVKYRQGKYTSPRGLVFFKAVYETIAPAEGEDADGDVWRFQGQFNALCRGGQYELGPIVFSGQLIVTQDPITTPVLVRHGASGGGSCEDDYQYAYGGSYDPYSAGSTDNSGCGTPTDDGTIGVGGGSSTGSNCHTEYIYVDMSQDGGLTWTTIWEGETLVCG
jgi:hypothetical protein